MHISPVKTHRIEPDEGGIEFLLDKYIQAGSIPERSVIAVTSKIVSMCEGRTVKIEESKGTGETRGAKDYNQKDQLIEQESQFFLPRSESPYNVSFAIRDDILAPSAGIDESNGNGYYILWPENPQASANRIRAYLSKRLALSEIGVIITDSKTSPLRWGVTGIGLSHSGFRAVNDYVGKNDLFGRPFEYEKVNVMDSLSAAAAFVMGEGSESTPLAVISDIPHVTFQKRNPTEEEIKELHISMDEDLYAPFLKNAPWKKGKKAYSK